MIQGRSLS